MGRKRKREIEETAFARDCEPLEDRCCRGEETSRDILPGPPKAKRSACSQPNQTVDQPLLKAYYLSVTTLRTYLISRLPRSSRRRRKNIAAIPTFDGGAEPKLDESGPSLTKASVEQHRLWELARLLDTTCVGFNHLQNVESNAEASQDFMARIQTQSNGLMNANDHNTHQERPSQKTRPSRNPLSDSRKTQHELIDFAVGRLFTHKFPREQYPPHTLCHGFRRSYQQKSIGAGQDLRKGVNSLDCHFPNAYVASLKSRPWQRILELVALEGDVKIMLDLILDCGVFVPVDGPGQNYYQLSGKLLSDLPRLNQNPSGDDAQTGNKTRVSVPAADTTRKPSQITFVRSRILHGRAALNRYNETRFGLPHIHVLNKYKRPSNMNETKHVLMYIFPRQHDLHNVFTSFVDSRETAQPFKDYALREKEIGLAQQRHNRNMLSTPLRLRCLCSYLVQKLRILHSRCSFMELLKYYCPISQLDSRASSKQRRQQGREDGRIPLSTLLTGGMHKSQDQEFTEFATSIAQVSAYCRAVLTNILPHEFFGLGNVGEKNRQLLMQHIDQFVTCTRFEKVTLHAVAQGMKVSEIPWLSSPNTRMGTKLSRTEHEKRIELFLEFLYYVFDSLLIPLLRSTFHVTESSQHGNRLFYFRHDLWRALTEPSLRELKKSTFDEIPRGSCRALIDQRHLGVGQMRLVPKGTGIRMITNLRHRAMVTRNHGARLCTSINTQLATVHCMLKFERSRNADFLGASIFSTGDIYPRIKAFKDRLLGKYKAIPKLYFAKVDVQSCFDTIPQAQIVRLMHRLCGEETYSRVKHVEMRNIELRARKFVTSARSVRDLTAFRDRVAALAAGKRATVFVEAITGQNLVRDDLLRLLTEHVQEHIIKIGKRHYRQKTGIPQGSVVSALLCSFFYADFEREHLSRFHSPETLLLRLIDDFILISPSREHATDFVRVMHAGQSDYGIQVKPAKTLVNFACTIDGIETPMTASSVPFPYCGITIHTRSLAIQRDRARRIKSDIRDALTVERGGPQPGHQFARKIIHAFRIQLGAMLLDTQLSGRTAVLDTIFQSAMETAMKLHRYLKIFQQAQSVDGTLVVGTIRRLARLAVGMARQGKWQAARAGIHSGTCPGAAERANLSMVLPPPPPQDVVEGASGFACKIQASHMEWLVLSAFREVLAAKPTAYVHVLAALDHRLKSLAQRGQRGHPLLQRIVARGSRVYAGYRF